MKIGLIVGSIRKESWNKKVALVVKDLFPKDIEVDFIDISYLNLYNPDLDNDKPLDSYVKIRNEVKKYDGYIFFTPEYNRSYSPHIKNVLDIVSRDPNGSAWMKKPAAIFSASPGGYGGMGANQALRQVFVNLDIMPMQAPEVYLSKIHQSFDANGMIDSTKVLLTKAVNAFIDHAKKYISN